MKKLVITGGSGFLGSALIAHAHKSGYDVTVLGRRPVDGVTSIACDISDAASVRSAFAGLKADAVIHAAAVVTGATNSEYHAINTLGTKNIADAVGAMSEPAHLIVCGSGFEYRPQDRPVTEADLIGPWNAYGLSKAMASSLLKDYEKRFPISLVRLFSLYGAGEKSPRLAPWIIEQAMRGQVVELTPGTQVRDYTYISDAAEGIFRIMDVPPTNGQMQTLNLSRGIGMTLREFVSAITEALKDSGINAVVDHEAKPHRSDEVMSYVADVTELRRILAWSPQTSPAQGARMMVDSYLNRSSDSIH